MTFILISDFPIMQFPAFSLLEEAIRHGKAA